MGERGRRRQREEFSRDAMVAQVSELYRRLLRTNGVSAPATTPPNGGVPGAASRP
jgi:hypothetical protein